jgi:hypothetical protein
MVDTKVINSLVKKLNKQIKSGVELFKKYKKISKIYLKTKIDLKKNQNKKSYESMLVDTEKNFLREKKKINLEKKKILLNILEIGEQIKSYMTTEKFNDFIKKMYKKRYNVLDDKTISFKKLLHHLESGQVSENISKTVKNIDDLMTIGNIDNRKKQMEIGIKKKEKEIILKKIDENTIQFINKLKKIIIGERDTKMREKLFHKTIREKRNKNSKVITNNAGNPVMEEIEEINLPEFNKLINSEFQLNLLQTDTYQPEIDKYNLKRVKLLDKLTSLEKEIEELK